MQCDWDCVCSDDMKLLFGFWLLLCSVMQIVFVMIWSWCVVALCVAVTTVYTHYHIPVCSHMSCQHDGSLVVAGGGPKDPGNGDPRTPHPQVWSAWWVWCFDFVVCRYMRMANRRKSIIKWERHLISRPTTHTTHYTKSCLCCWWLLLMLLCMLSEVFLCSAIHQHPSCLHT